MTPDKTEAAILAGATRTDISGVSLEILQVGQGRPLVFLHGMDGLEGSRDLIHALSKQFKVIAPSHPGFGASDLPASFDTIDDVAYLYLDLLETLKLNDALVVGLSFGGWVATEMLIKNRTGVSQLALGAPLGIRTSDRRRQDMTDIFMLPEREREQLLQLTPCAETTHDDENRLRRALRNREAVSTFGWSPYLNDPKLNERLHRIRLPTLVIWGANDRLIPSKYGEAYVRALPNARLETIESCGHRIHIDQPGKLQQLIGRFASTDKVTEVQHAHMAV